MAYTKNQKEKIRFDYESGRYNGQQIAEKWEMSAQTLKKFSDEGGWVLGCRNEELSRQVEESVAETLIRKDARRLIKYVEEHLDVIGQIDDTYRVLLSLHIQELRESEGLLTKADGEKWKSNYQALQVAIDSFDKSFRSKRLAMGLKETEGPKVEMNFNLNKIENLSGLSDKELDYIIANEGAVESTTIN